MVFIMKMESEMVYKYVEGYRWVVWVGAEPNYFYYREDAQDYADAFTEQGYTDVKLERA
jgi:hypothetical protein